MKFLINSIEGFVTNYGYYAVFLGSLFEGESIVLTAGAFAYKGMLDIKYVMLLSFLATLLSEQLFFYIGRFFGIDWLKGFPKIHHKMLKAVELLHKYHTEFILTCRFIYGIRTISPLIIGFAKVPPARFALLNAIAAAIWSILISTIGYGIGYISHIFGYQDLGSYVMIVIFLLISLVMLPKIIKEFLHIKED